MPRSRVLVWGLSNNRAGTEAVISSYVRHLPNIKFDFLCYEKPTNYSDLFSPETNNRFFVIPIKIKHPFSYTKNLKHFMEEHGSEYHTLWFNVNDISNIDLLVYAQRYGIERRITHMHNSKIPNILVTKLFSKFNWRKCLQLTTDRWACSDSAGKYLYSSLEYKVIPNMVDAESRSFNLMKRNDLRRAWSLEDTWLIGTVGRLAAQKNQAYLIRLMPQIVKENPKAKLLIVGEGPLRDELSSIAIQLNVKDQVLFAGSQSDVQAYYSSFDVFALPSLYEGLSISLLEAQYNGLPCVTSEGLDAHSIISSNVKRVPLTETDEWANALLHSSREEGALIEDKASNYDLVNISTVISEMF